MFDCLAFHQDTTNDGLLPVAPAPGGVHGYQVSGDNLQTKWAGIILALMNQSEAIANFVDANIGDSTDENENRWTRSPIARDQTGLPRPPLVVGQKFGNGSLLVCNHDHGANLQVANTTFLVSSTRQKLYFGYRPSGVPEGCVVITANGVTPAIANRWEIDVATYVYPFNTNKMYDVYGFACFSPTGYAGRIYPQSDNTSWRPGWIMGNTNIQFQWIYSETPMYAFTGKTPPQFQKICQSTDSTTTRYMMLIKER